MVPRKACIRACVIQILAAVAAPAFADQGTPGPDATENQPKPRVEEITVTGSRIARDTFSTPNPVTVVGSEEMQKLGLSNVGDVVAQLPQNSAFVTAGNVGLGNFNIGAQLAA